MSVQILVQTATIFAQVALLVCLFLMARHCHGYNKPRSRQEWIDLFTHCDQQDNLRTKKKPCRIRAQEDNVDYDEVHEMRNMLIGGENG